MAATRQLTFLQQPFDLFRAGDYYGSLHNQAKSAEYLEKAQALGANRQDPIRRSELETRIQFARAMANPEAMSEKDLRIGPPAATWRRR